MGGGFFFFHGVVGKKNLVCFFRWRGGLKKKNPPATLVTGAKQSTQQQLTKAFALHPLNGVVHELRCVFQAELLFDVGTMGLNRFDTEMQFLSDRTGAVTLADKTEDFELAVAQFFDRRTAQ